MTQLLSSQSVAVAGAAAVAYSVAKRQVDYYQTDLVKLPHVSGGHWFYGHELDAFQQEDFYTSQADKIGLTYTIKAGFFHPDILITVDPGALSHILSKNVYDYVKSPVIRPLIDRLLGKGIVWAEGDDHKKMRTILAPVFTADAVKACDEEVRTATDKLVASLHSHIESVNTDSSSFVRVNILEWTSRATLDIIGAIGFGHDFRCGESPEAKAIFESWKKTVELGLDTPGLVAQMVLKTFPFIPHLPVPAIQAQGEIKSIVRGLALKLIAERKAIGLGSKDGKDLMSRLMRLQGEEDMEQLLDHITTFVMVGHETTSATINYALLELSRSPKDQDRLRQELTNFVGTGIGGEASYEEYQSKLPFLDAVMKEAFRLYPPASHTERTALKDDIIPLRFPVTGPSGEKVSTIKIKAGQSIGIPSIAVNRNKTTWGPDGDKFIPQRWISNDLPPPTALTQGWGGLFTFLEGPRMCIGYRLAIFEFKVIMGSLIKHFEFADTGATVVSRFSSTLQPRVLGEEPKGIQIPLDVKRVH